MQYEVVQRWNERVAHPFNEVYEVRERILATCTTRERAESCLRANRFFVPNAFIREVKESVK